MFSHVDYPLHVKWSMKTSLNKCRYSLLELFSEAHIFLIIIHTFPAKMLIVRIVFILASSLFFRRWNISDKKNNSFCSYCFAALNHFLNSAKDIGPPISSI